MILVIYICCDSQWRFILYDVKHFMNSYKYWHSVKQIHLDFVLFRRDVNLEGEISVVIKLEDIP